MQKVSDFQDLSTAEAALIDAVRAGQPCFLHDDPKAMPDADNPAHRIRADLLAVLITGGSPKCKLSPFGVNLFGAQITGELRLTHLSAVGDTTLAYCRFDSEPNLRQASLNNLNLDGCELPGLMAQRVKVGDSLFLRGTTTKGCVYVAGARIGGYLDCGGAAFNGGDGDALFAQGMEICAGLFMRNVTANGRVDLNSAKIGGQLACEGATFDGGDDDALNAQGLVVGASLFLRGITAKGRIYLGGGKIGGFIDCTGARFEGGERHALNAQGVDVEAGLFLRDIIAKGRVDMGGAKIGGQFACVGASFDGGDGFALSAEGLNVGAALIWMGTTVKAGRVSLATAHVRDLWDDVGNWPSSLDLDGFTYDRFHPTTTLAKDRLPWLKKGSSWKGTFSPQPYTQAAKVLRAMGHDGEARKILVAREQILAREVRRRWNTKDNGRAYLALENPYRTAGLGLLWLWDLAQRTVVGYGFAPYLALRALAVLLAVAFTLAHFTWENGDFAPNSDVILTSAGWQATLVYDCENFAPSAITVCDHNPANTWSGQLTRGMDWDTFNAPAYALDLVIPILTLGQTEAWAPSKDRGAWGRALWWGRWVLIIGGWLVSALGVAAITGVMQRERE